MLGIFAMDTSLAKLRLSHQHFPWGSTGSSSSSQATPPFFVMFEASCRESLVDTFDRNTSLCSSQSKEVPVDGLYLVTTQYSWLIHTRENDSNEEVHTLVITMASWEIPINGHENGRIVKLNRMRCKWACQWENSQAKWVILQPSTLDRQRAFQLKVLRAKESLCFDMFDWYILPR